MNQLVNLKKYQAIIFDFDGVLVQSVDIKTKAFAALYEEHGPGIVKKVVEYHIQNGGMSRYQKFKYYHETLLNRVLTSEMSCSLDVAFSKQVMQQVINAPAVLGAEEFLKKYYQLLPFFVCSATPHDELVAIIQQRKMAHYFDSVYGSPRKKEFLIDIIIKQNNFQPQKVIMIGDALNDYWAAHANQIDFLGIGSASQFPPNTLCVDNFRNVVLN